MSGQHGRIIPITREQLKAARRLLGWSQAALAAKAGISQTMVARWEANKSCTEENQARVRAVLEAAGVEFTTGAPLLQGHASSKDAT